MLQHRSLCYQYLSGGRGPQESEGVLLHTGGAGEEGSSTLATPAPQLVPQAAKYGSHYTDDDTRTHKHKSDLAAYT